MTKNKRKALGKGGASKTPLIPIGEVEGEIRALSNEQLDDTNLVAPIIKRPPPEPVIVGNRKIIVHVATFVMSLRLQGLRKDIEKVSSNSLEEYIARYHFYAPMVACSTGDIPTEAEFLEMTDEEINPWYLVAERKNPKWFDSSEASEKKSK